MGRKQALNLDSPGMDYGTGLPKETNARYIFTKRNLGVKPIVVGTAKGVKAIPG
jgi:hypothetical protein